MTTLLYSATRRRLNNNQCFVECVCVCVHVCIHVYVCVCLCVCVSLTLKLQKFLFHIMGAVINFTKKMGLALLFVVDLFGGKVEG